MQYIQYVLECVCSEQCGALQVHCSSIWGVLEGFSSKNTDKEGITRDGRQ